MIIAIFSFIATCAALWARHSWRKLQREMDTLERRHEIERRALSEWMRQARPSNVIPFPKPFDECNCEGHGRYCDKCRAKLRANGVARGDL